MALYQDWQQRAQQAQQEENGQQYWNDYFEKETGAYRAILTANNGKVAGTLGELAKGFSMEPVEFAGFLDGVNTSLTEEQNLEELTEETPIDVTIDFEKLFYNMLNAKAPWLYGLEEWAGVLPEEKRHEITRRFKEDHIFHAPVTVGRNDPCPCGSGKKYKKCCGANQ